MQCVWRIYNRENLTKSIAFYSLKRDSSPMEMWNSKSLSSICFPKSYYSLPTWGNYCLVVFFNSSVLLVFVFQNLIKVCFYYFYLVELSHRVLSSTPEALPPSILLPKENKFNSTLPLSTPCDLFY